MKILAENEELMLSILFITGTFSNLDNMIKTIEYK